MAEASKLEEQINAISNNTTEVALSSLKTELSMTCLDPARLTRLRDIVKQKNNISEVTREKLNTLLQDCSQEKSEKSYDSSESFTRAFEGTKSEMFSPEKIKTFEGFIDESFEKKVYEKLDSKQKINIRLAMMDKLLKDPEIQKLFDMKIGVVDILSGMVKGAGPKSLQEAEGAKESPSVVASISQADGIIKTITERLMIATKPLADLLKNNDNLTVFLSNPKAIAEYNGGEIASGIQGMSKSDLDQYIKGLNGDIRHIDAKIFPMEMIKEKGMNFLAEAPSFLVDFFKWLLSFDFIAKLLGYKDGSDAIGLIDEELKQRKSLNVLREFGKMTPLEGGQPKEGKYSGKIDILKGQDLSKLNRKKLAPFFQFTKEEGIETGTPDFWIGIFEQGEIVKKDEKGVEVRFTLEKGLDSKDLEKDFEGLYGKLNGLLKKQKAIKQQEVDRMAREKQEAATRESDAAAAQQETHAKAQKATAEKTLKDTLPYRDVANGLIINDQVLAKIKDITIDDFMNGTYVGKVERIYKGDANKNTILQVLSTYAGLVNNPKTQMYLATLKGSMNGKLTFETLSYQRHKILAAAGFTGEYLKQTETIFTDIQKREAGVGGKTQEVQKPKDDTEVLVKAFENAKSIPFAFGDKMVDFKDNQLIIGENKYTLEITKDGETRYVVSEMDFNGNNVSLGYKFSQINPVTLLRKEIISGIPAMLLMENKTKKEIEGDDKKGKLIITRTA